MIILRYHDCPDCGSACYCDMDDSNLAIDINDCEHDCAEEKDDTDYEAEVIEFHETLATTSPEATEGEKG